ncbi:MAG: hypothetical protein CL677_06290 [Bdellovibrionaceae bacterium]|nr:hypothetical protein [Pseudobdellovibrionaceae bacterium]
MKDNLKLILITLVGLGLAIANSHLSPAPDLESSKEHATPVEEGKKNEPFIKAKKRLEKSLKKDPEAALQQLQARPGTIINTALFELVKESTTISGGIIEPIFDSHAFIESSSEEPDHLMQDAQLAVNTLTDCLSDQVCGFESLLRNNERGFFDRYNTPVHDTLDNALAIIDRLDELGLSDTPDMTTLLNAMSVQHGRIPLTALKIALARHPSQIPFDQVFQKGHELKGQTKGRFFGELAKARLDAIAPDVYTEFKVELERVLKDSTDRQATLVARMHIKDMKLNNSEFLALHRASCHYLLNAGDESTARYFLREFDRQSSGRNLHVNSSQLCQ